MKPIFPELFKMLPNADDLLNLEPEELAGPLLISLEKSQSITLDYVISSTHMSDAIQRGLHGQQISGYSGHYDEVLKALMEAWQWLEREGFVAIEPPDLVSGKNFTDKTRYFVTRRGQRIETPDALDSYRKANLLPKDQLPPIIAQKVSPKFWQGDYDTAVFQAFKEVEIAVRKAGNYDESDHGVSLMRQAFHVDTGKSDAGELTDTEQQPAEQEAIGHLFAGAIGYCRNPLGHREVNLSAEEAVEMVFFASYLLRIVDSRKQSEES